MNRPLVSVIVPCYNMSAFLEETLTSIVASDYRPLEVIVIDDGSTDGSAEKAEAFFSNLQTLNLQTLNCHLLRTANGYQNITKYPHTVCTKNTGTR